MCSFLESFIFSVLLVIHTHQAARGIAQWLGTLAAPADPRLHEEESMTGKQWMSVLDEKITFRAHEFVPQA